MICIHEYTSICLYTQLLTINGKEAFRDPSTQINVDVPGLIVGHHEIAVTVLDIHATPLASQRHQFEMRKGYSWVQRKVIVSDDAAACSCTSNHVQVCSFLIDARGDGSSPATGHFFRVRLVGPAIVMGSIYELTATPGVYKVEYTAVDSGVYSMSVVLLHASHTALADPGQGIRRQFINQHIQGSPFQVRVAHHMLSNVTYTQADARRKEGGGGGFGKADTYSGFGKGQTQSFLCQGLRRHGTHSNDGTGPPWSAGRWVHRDVCLWFADGCEGVKSHLYDQTDDDAFHHDPWVWVPYGACLHLPTLRRVSLTLRLVSLTSLTLLVHLPSWST